jgi:hypothetical protein
LHFRAKRRSFQERENEHCGQCKYGICLVDEKKVSYVYAVSSLHKKKIHQLLVDEKKVYPKKNPAEAGAERRRLRVSGVHQIGIELLDGNILDGKAVKGVAALASLLEKKRARDESVSRTRGASAPIGPKDRIVGAEGVAPSGQRPVGRILDGEKAMLVGAARIREPDDGLNGDQLAVTQHAHKARSIDERPVRLGRTRERQPDDRPVRDRNCGIAELMSHRTVARGGSEGEDAAVLLVHPDDVIPVLARRTEVEPSVTEREQAALARTDGTLLRRRVTSGAFFAHGSAKLDKPREIAGATEIVGEAVGSREEHDVSELKVQTDEYVIGRHVEELGSVDILLPQGLDSCLHAAAFKPQPHQGQSLIRQTVNIHSSTISLEKTVSVNPEGNSTGGGIVCRFIRPVKEGGRLDSASMIG